MAVRIDIRPRLTLRDERPAPRRRFQLPPLAVPAVGYWLGMAALTYFFTTLGEGTTPFDFALAPAVEPAPALRSEPAPAPPAPSPAPLVASATRPTAEPEAVTASQPSEHETETEAEPRDPTPVAARPAASEGEEREAPSARQAVTESPVARWDEPVPRLAFPEFTDSTSPARRERASDGPRIDGLFERRADLAPQPSTSSAAPAPVETEREGPVAVSSCEAAIARNNETIELGAPRGPTDITREAYAGILQDGRYLTGCSIPDRTVFEICAAVRDGRAVGITVTSSPASASLNACVRRAVSRLKFPKNPRLDVTHTRFDAARR